MKNKNNFSKFVNELEKDFEGMKTNEKLFTIFYLQTFNGAKAVEMMNKDLKDSQANKNMLAKYYLSKPKVKDVINKFLKYAIMDALSVQAKISEIATADIGDFITVDEDDNYKIDLKKAKAEGKTHLIKKITTRDGAISIEMYNAQEALYQLAKMHGLINDRITINTNSDNIDNTVQELLKALDKNGGK